MTDPNMNRRIKKNHFRQPPRRMVRKRDGQDCRHATALYKTREAARREARAASQRYGGYFQPYFCIAHVRWHIRKAKRLDAFIENNRMPADTALMIDLLGERAFFCGHIESIGRQRYRKRAIKQRVRAAQKHAARKVLPEAAGRV